MCNRCNGCNAEDMMRLREYTPLNDQHGNTYLSGHIRIDTHTKLKQAFTDELKKLGLG